MLSVLVGREASRGTTLEKQTSPFQAKAEEGREGFWTDASHSPSTYLRQTLLCFAGPWDTASSGLVPALKENRSCLRGLDGG